MGQVYYNGAYGIPKNIPRALEYFWIAAKAGNMDAIAQLGTMHRKGEGVEANNFTALEFYRKAAAEVRLLSTEPPEY